MTLSKKRAVPLHQKTLITTAMTIKLKKMNLSQCSLNSQREQDTVERLIDHDNERLLNDKLLFSKSLILLVYKFVLIVKITV
jgi:hypothetical protein